MKVRASLVAVVIGALVVPAVALAARSVIHGPAGGGSGTVDITLFSKKGTVQKLSRFEFNNIQVTCRGFPPSATSGTFPHTIKVDKDGTFDATAKVNGGRATATVHGDFSSVSKASGTLRVKGTVPGCSRADSGKVHWSAKHN